MTETLKESREAEQMRQTLKESRVRGCETGEGSGANETDSERVEGARL